MNAAQKMITDAFFDLFRGEIVNRDEYNHAIESQCLLIYKIRNALGMSHIEIINMINEPNDLNRLKRSYLAVGLGLVIKDFS